MCEPALTILTDPSHPHGQASCKTAAEGGEFKEPVTMELWNADDYVMEVFE